MDFITDLPRSIGFQPPLFPWDSPSGPVPHVEAWYQDCRRAWRLVQRSLRRQGELHKKQADRHRRRGFPYRAGQQVWLSTRNLRIPGCKKLTARYIGPFRILKRLGPVTMKLELPRVYRINPTFHVSLLKPVKHGTVSASPDTPDDLPPSVADEGPSTKIRTILNSRRRQVSSSYLILQFRRPPPSSSSFPFVPVLQCWTALPGRFAKN
ncbi:uncharacterized protein [Paramormyrops kingsleyae]|uniref:uncharacterized protein n=1 Tax=Paramormyrops kingsleyae TaxID=1676925 RepID=UPI003B96EF4A